MKQFELLTRLTVNQWNALWRRGACWQGMDRAEVERYAETRPSFAVCEVYADGFRSMYGAAPSGWIEDGAA